MLDRLPRVSLAAMFNPEPHERSERKGTMTRRALVREMRSRAMATRQTANQRLRNGIDIDRFLK
jgi:hypothetical protein